MREEIAGMDLSQLRVTELLALHVQIAEQLRSRGITRTSNNLTGDLAEILFCRAFGWTQTGNSTRHVDAVALDGTRYQIKGRRLRRPSDREMSVLRNLDGAHFDYLAGVFFRPDYTVMRAAVVPHAVALEKSFFDDRANGHKFFLRDDVWEAPGVRDVTSALSPLSIRQSMRYPSNLIS